MQVAGAVGAGAVFYNSRYEPAMRHTDAAVASQLSAAGLSVHAHAALLLQEPWNVKVCVLTAHLGGCLFGLGDSVCVCVGGVARSSHTKSCSLSCAPFEHHAHM